MSEVHSAGRSHFTDVQGCFKIQLCFPLCSPCSAKPCFFCLAPPPATARARGQSAGSHAEKRLLTGNRNAIQLAGENQDLVFLCLKLKRIYLNELRIIKCFFTVLCLFTARRTIYLLISCNLNFVTRASSIICEFDFQAQRECL